MDNTLDLECGLVEMSQVELQETGGGCHPALVVAACVGGGILGLAVGIGVCYLAYKYL